MSLFQPMRETNRSLAGRIVDSIRDMVERGQLKPGERLPPERELAAQLGVSRTALREALHTLAALELVEVRHGRGVFVVGDSVQATVQRLSLALSEQPATAGSSASSEAIARLRELFDIRRVLEGAAAEWAAQRATSEQIAEMRTILASDRAARTAEQVDSALISELDGRLHALIAASTTNRTLMLLMAVLLDELAQARNRSLALPGRITRSLYQHEALVSAIATHDVAGARAAMLEHVNDVERTILEHLAQDGASNA